MSALRLATPVDAAAVRAIYAPFVEDSWVSFETAVPSVDEVARRIAVTGPAHPWLVAEAEGTVVGYAYAGPHRTRAAYRWSAEVSAYVAEGQRGRGVGRALYWALLDVLRIQGFATALAGITQPNAPSVAFHHALGFEAVGVYRRVGFKLGGWRDVGWWSLALGDGNAPDAPQPLDAVAETVAERLRAG